MKILFAVHQFFPEHYTGSERLVLNLSKQMQRMGHSVKVITYGIKENEGFRRDGDFLIKEYVFQGVPVISVRHKIIPPYVSFSIFDKKMVQIIEKRIFSNETFDAVHVCHPMRVGSIIKAAQHKKIPVVLTLTDFWLMCPRGIAVTQNGELCHSSENGNKCIEKCFGNSWKDKLIQRFGETQEVFQAVDCVVSATNFLKQLFEMNNFSSKIKLIRFGKDYSNVRYNVRKYSEDSKITLGFLSTLLPHKGPHILIDAYNKANMENIRLRIYGHYFHEIDYFNTLKKLAGDNEKVEFCGKYEYEEMPNILDGMDVLVVPSIWWENSPLVLLRALAHNVPAIVSNLGGMTEVIEDGVNGFIFEAGNAESLAQVLNKVGANPTILNEMKNNIHHPPRIEEEAFEYEKIYFKLISQKVQNSAENGNNEMEKTSKGIYGDDFIYEIHKKDEMFQFLVNHPTIDNPSAEYFRSGESMLISLQEILRDINYSFDQIDSFLDFASGYGRFTRFLLQKLSPEKITVSDIDKNAVNFCKKTFNVNGFNSVMNPDLLINNKKYDSIYVASLFSHLSMQLWIRWFERLYDMVDEDGILILSTHGMDCYDILSEEIKKSIESIDEGFYYIKESETNRLSNNDYGTTYVTYNFVKNIVDQYNLGEIIAYYPKKLWKFQDIYVIKKIK